MPSKEALEHYKEGMSLYGKGDPEAAAAAYAKALELEPDWADAMQALGMAQMRLGKLDEALATLQRVVELSPDDPLAYTSLSMVWVRKENIEEAEKAQAQARMLSWQQELKTNPDAPPPDLGPPGMNVTQ